MVEKKILEIDRVYDVKEKTEQIYTPDKSVYINENIQTYPSTNESLVESHFLSSLSLLVLIALIIGYYASKKRKMF